LTSLRRLGFESVAGRGVASEFPKTSWLSTTGLDLTFMGSDSFSIESI